jgi:hypothetical protein
MDEVSPMNTQEAGAGPKVKRTDTIRPSDACARLDAVVMETEPAIPRAIKKMKLAREPHR